MTYWAIFPAMFEDGAVLSAVPDSGPEDFEYDEGIPLLDGYPDRDQAIMVFDPDYPDHIKLYDILPSMDTVLVVNSKVKEALSALKISKIEYLPIRLLDHRQNPVSDDYYILNPLGSVDFIDMKKSDYVMDSLDEEQIFRIKNLVINHDAISGDTKIFRASTKMSQLFIHDDVRIALEKAGIQGYKLFAAEGWNGLDI